MEAKNFRIGNLIASKTWSCFGVIGGIEKFRSHTEFKVGGHIHKFKENEYFDLKPIVLTEELLTQLGFVKDKTEIAVYYNGDFEIQLPVYFKYKDSHLRKLKYVHELQNLFFALTFILFVSAAKPITNLGLREL